MNHTNRDDFWEWVGCIVIVGMAIIVASILNATASDSVDWSRHQAAAAIAIHNAIVSPQSLLVDVPAPPTDISKPKPEKEARPVVKMYTATWCAPCQRAKAELKGAKLPFDIQYIDVSRGGQPAWCESIPAFAWESNGQTRYVLGFPGVSRLIQQWQATEKTTARIRAPPANRWPDMSGYKAQWTWPGDLRRHLQATHGVTEASQLTQDQAEALHDALHEGRSLNQIRARFR